MLFGQGGAMGMHASMHAKEVIGSEQSVMSQIGIIAEMSAAMVVPAIPISATDLIWPGTFGPMSAMWSHGAMLLGMAVLMIVQRDMYAGHDHSHAHPSAGPLDEPAATDTTPKFSH